MCTRSPSRGAAPLPRSPSGPTSAKRTAGSTLARIATIRAQLLAPVLLVIMFLGAFMARRHVADILCFLFFGLLGWTMKRQGWPRPPLIIGFVLGSTVEKYLYISILTYGWSWLWRPWVIVLFLLILAALAAPAVQQYRSRNAVANP